MMELKPCPFCGCEHIEDWGESTWSRPVKWMYCTECQAQGPRVMLGRGEDDQAWLERAIAAWNRRAPDPRDDAIRALMEALEDTASEALSSEIQEGFGPEITDDPEFHRGYDAALRRVRAALAKVKDAGK